MVDEHKLSSSKWTGTQKRSLIFSATSLPISRKVSLERLGHKDIQTTLQTYTFNTEIMQQNAVDVIENIMHV